MIRIVEAARSGEVEGTGRGPLVGAALGWSYAYRRVRTRRMGRKGCLRGTLCPAAAPGYTCAVDGLDLNLLIALDALLMEESVTGAARRLGLSTSAMSRTLDRLRSATGDPLLVRAGRGLVATPRAAALRARVPALVSDARAVLRPAVDPLDTAALDATFTIRASEGFMDVIAPLLAAEIMEAAPCVRLRFVPKPDKNLRHLREGRIDLEVGAYGELAPEVRTRLLFRDRFVGVARSGHPLLAGGEPTPEGFASCSHVATSHRGEFSGPVDDSLEELGLRRKVALVVPGFPAALRIARSTSLVAVVPRSSLGVAPSGDLAAASAAVSGLDSFDLPFRLPEIAVSAMWHPRMDADPAHRWLRSRVVGFCKKVLS